MFIYTTLCAQKKPSQKNGFSAYVRMLFYIIAICGTNQIIGYFFDSYYFFSASILDLKFPSKLYNWVQKIR
jgi:hypothetical protein